MSEQSAIFEEFCGPGHGTWDRGCFMDRALRLLPSIVYIFNQDTQSNEYSNRSIGDVMGYSSEEVLAFGPNLMGMLCHPDDLPRVAAHFERIARLDDGETASIEYRVRHKAGHWVWFLSMDTVFERHRDGHVRRHLGAAADITELKTAEQRSRAASHAAEVANQDLRAFTYAISHDMKSPLNTIHLLLRELEDCHGTSLVPDARQLLEKARSTSQGMQRRIERVLDYTRSLEPGVSHKPVALDHVLKDVLVDLEAEIAAASARIEVTPLPVVTGQEQELRVLFTNLLSNALKFRQSGVSPLVRVFASGDRNQSNFSVTVADNGIGVPPTRHEFIFEMFKRLHSEKAYPGNGLGLAICRRIAVSHGGDIQVTSQEGQGAAFIVTLPVHREGQQPITRD